MPRSIDELSADENAVARARIDALPAPARDFAYMFEGLGRERSAILSGLFAERTAAQARKTDAAAALGREQREADRVPHDEGHSAAVAAAKARLDRETAALARIQTHIEKVNGKPTFDADRITTFLASRAGKYGMKEVKVDRRRNEPLTTCLHRNLEGRSDFLEQEEVADNSDLTKEEALTPMVAEIRRRAKAPGVGTLFKLQDRGGARRVQGGVKWPMRFQDSPPQIDLEGVFFWLHGDALIEKLTAEVNNRKSTHVLSRSERELRKAEVRRALRELEYQEGALYRELYASGSRVPIRPDISIDALLGIELIEAAPKPSTTPSQHVTGNIGTGMGHRIIA